MADGRFVYMSCAADKEILVFAMNRDSGALRPRGRVAVPGTGEPSPSSMPLAVSPDRRFLYAALRTPPFPVTSFAIDPRTGGLTPIGSATLPDSMAYIVTDGTGRHLLSASYPGAKLASNPIDPTGRVQATVTQVVPTAPKAHSILPSPDNRFVYAAVLGGDHVMQLAFDAEAGRMTPLTPDAADQPRRGAATPALPPAPQSCLLRRRDGRNDHVLCPRPTIRATRPARGSQRGAGRRAASGDRCRRRSADHAGWALPLRDGPQHEHGHRLRSRGGCTTTNWLLAGSAGAPRHRHRSRRAIPARGRAGGERSRGACDRPGRRPQPARRIRGRRDAELDRDHRSATDLTCGTGASG